MRKLAVWLVLSVLLLASLPTSAQDDAFTPFHSEIYEISGIFPDGWTEVGTGVYVSPEYYSNPVPLTLLIQTTSLDTTPAEMLVFLEGMLEMTAAPTPTDSLETDSFDWQLYEAHIDTDYHGTVPVDIALASDERLVYVVLLVTYVDDRADHYQSIFVPAVEALAPYPPTEWEPLPYTREKVTFPSVEDVQIAGTLTLPPTPGPHRAVVLISGSGANDRDETLLPLADFKPFALIADHLTRQGVAVLRYDDRGVGHSTGDHESATSADFADDAEAAVTYLGGRADIGPVGLLGHSEGGLIAAMVAARNADVAFVVSMAGPAVIGHELIMVQQSRIIDAMGISGTYVDDQVALLARQLELVMADDIDGLRALLNDAVIEQLADMSDVPAPFQSVEDFGQFLVQQEMDQAASVWFRFFLTHDPALDWAQVRVPVLGLFGDLDVQVDVDQNMPALEAALADNPDVTLISFPTANHLFQDAVTGSLDEYGELPPEFVPDFLPTISEWIVGL